MILDVYNELIAWGDEDIITKLTDETMVAGVLISGWQQAEILEFRSRAWRSAHNFVVKNINTVDRGRELEELVSLLQVCS